jgi:acetylornithine deacetylase/succinyl-diaminopimelate desuccinylase-like protein
MEDIYQYIDANRERYLSELSVFLRQPSISSQNIGVAECARLLKGMMEDVGIHTEILPMGGKNNPPLVYGEILSPGAQKTVLIYGHFDVQPPEPLELWDSPPFEPTIRDGRIFARGATDNKGHVLAHIKAVEAVLKKRGSLPVNIKFLFDPEEEMGSPSMDGFLRANADRFSADYAFNADGPADPSGRPMISFGSRGTCYVQVTHQEAARDLHSGQFGGPVPNPNWRMIRFLQTLLDADGRVAIDGFYDDVIPPTPIEREAVAAIPMDEAKMMDYLGVNRFNKPETLSYWEKLLFQPSFEICGYGSGYAGVGTKTVLPCTAQVKIDMRLVKNQTPGDIYDKFRRHMEKHGFGDMDLKPMTAYNPFKTPLDHPMSRAVISAVKKVFGVDPLLYPTTGSSSPVYIIKDFLKIPIIKVPYCRYDACNHAPNENLVIDLFYQGIKCSATVLFEMADIG